MKTISYTQDSREVANPLAKNQAVSLTDFMKSNALNGVKPEVGTSSTGAKFLSLISSDNVCFNTYFGKGKASETIADRKNVDAILLSKLSVIGTENADGEARHKIFFTADGIGNRISLDAILTVSVALESNPELTAQI